MSSVSRSEYQKIVEENKRLKHDIYIMCSQEDSLASLKLILLNKWRKKFNEEKEFIDSLYESLTTFNKAFK